MKHREQSQVDAVHAFKLLCHDLDIIQHHMRARAQKFKAIALCFFFCVCCLGRLGGCFSCQRGTAPRFLAPT